jgi:hypothetical protein
MTTVHWSGKSGTAYDFTVYDLSTTFYPVPGVYIFGRWIPVNGIMRPEALYVGEAKSLEDRLNTNRTGHDGFKRALKAGMTFIAARVAPADVSQRLRIETDLRHGLNPSCNAEPVPTNALTGALLRW